MFHKTLEYPIHPDLKDGFFAKEDVSHAGGLPSCHVKVNLSGPLHGEAE